MIKCTKCIDNKLFIKIKWENSKEYWLNYDFNISWEFSILSFRKQQWWLWYKYKKLTMSISFWYLRCWIWYIHRILAINFIPNSENKPCINHIDWNKLNNNLDNLEWVTYSENTIHSVRKLGNKPNTQINHHFKNKKWELSKFSKKVFQYDLNNTLINTFNSLWECSKNVNIPISTICRNICNNRTIKNFIFKY